MTYTETYTAPGAANGFDHLVILNYNTDVTTLPEVWRVEAASTLSPTPKRTFWLNESGMPRAAAIKEEAAFRAYGPPSQTYTGPVLEAWNRDSGTGRAVVWSMDALGRPRLGVDRVVGANTLVLGVNDPLPAGIVPGTVIVRVAATPAGPNRVGNPGFETDTSGWSRLGPSTLTRSTADARTGTASGLLTATGAGNPQALYTVTAAPDELVDESIFLKWAVGATPRAVRIDAQFLDSAGGVIRSDLGTAITPNTSSWTEAALLDRLAPAGTVQVRLRVVGLNFVANDAVRLDDASVTA